MTRIAQIVSGLALVAVGFAGGYASAGKQLDTAAQDYAISNVLSDLIFISHIDHKRTEDLRGLLDVRLFDDVTHSRKSDSASSNADVLKARMRILSGVARLWHDLPPPNSKLIADAKNQPWYEEWQSTYELNLKFVSAADADCRAMNCSPIFGTRQTIDRPVVEGAPNH